MSSNSQILKGTENGKKETQSKVPTRETRCWPVRLGHSNAKHVVCSFRERGGETVQSKDTVLVHSPQEEPCGYWLLCIPSMQEPPANYGQEGGLSGGISDVPMCDATGYSEGKLSLVYTALHGWSETASFPPLFLLPPGTLG